LRNLAWTPDRLGQREKNGVWGMSGLCFMPGGRILYSAKESAEANEIWMMDADGKERKRLTFDADNDFSPLISPDAHYIVFVSNRTGNFEIWRMNTDGSNPVQLTTSKSANMPAISPDRQMGNIYVSRRGQALQGSPGGWRGNRA